MNLVSTYKCFCDETRLRILNVLKNGPLCVCHLQEILNEGQVKMSKQLSYLKKHKVLRSKRWNNWTIYEIQEGDNPVLESNLKCLQDCSQEISVFKHDLERWKSLMERIGSGEMSCPTEIVDVSQKYTNEISKTVSNQNNCGC